MTWLPRLIFGGLASLAAPALAQQGIEGQEREAPSGQLVVVHEVLFEEHPYSGEMQVIVRLLAPLVAGAALDGSQMREDMDWACETWGVPAANSLSHPPDWVVVEMMEAPVERGQTTPEIRQLFESYRLQGSVCIWELF